MTRDQRIGLGVLLSMFDLEIRQLEAASKRAAESIALLPGCESYGGDVAVKAGTYQAAVEHAAPTLRALHGRIVELFPKVRPLV